MNRRVQGQVKQKAKRAHIRREIRAGRRMSMQQIMHNMHHEHHDEPAIEQVPVMEDPMPVAEGDHVLYRLDTDLSTGTAVEAEVARGSRGQMYNKRRNLLLQEPDGKFTVRKASAST